MHQYDRLAGGRLSSGDGYHEDDDQPSVTPDFQDNPEQEGPQENLLSEPVINALHSNSQENNDGIDQRGLWRPAWLQFPVLSIFLGFFVLCALSLSTMCALSLKYDGLFESRQSYGYVWRFGPTAILTVTSILWCRVETQALRYMPWIAQHYGMPLGENGPALDYTSMSAPIILHQSFKRKHHLVSLVVIVSLVLKVQIVLAPSLYSLEDISSTQQVDLEILDFFNPHATTSDIDTRPWYLVSALRDFELRRPFGYTEDRAFQTFSTSNGTGRGTIAAPINVTVDGFFTDTKCLKLESWRSSKLVIAQDELPWDEKRLSTPYTVDLEFMFQGCKSPISLKNRRYNWENSTFSNDYGVPRDWLGKWEVIDAGLKEQRPCSNLPQINTQTLYYSTRLNLSSGKGYGPYLISMAAILCTSTAWISEVQLIDDGIDPTTTAVSAANRTLVNADLFPLILRSYVEVAPDLYKGGWCPDTLVDIVCGPVAAAFRFLGDRIGYGGQVWAPPNDTSLYSTDTLYNLTMEVSRFLGPLIGHYRFRDVTNEELFTSGTRATTADRLLVTTGVCISMVVLFLFLSTIILIVLVRYERRTSTWFRDPASVLGNILFFKNHPDLITQPVEFVFPSTSESPDWISGFTPFVLRTWVQAILTIFVSCIVTGMLYSLHQSNISNGIVDISKEGYTTLGWTSIPALLMLTVSIYVSSCDTTQRSLTTISLLSMRLCSVQDIDISYINMLGLRSLYHGMQKRAWNVVLSQSLTLFCGFLTTLTSIVFSVEAIADPTTTNISQITWFGNREIDGDVQGVNRKKISSIIWNQKDGALTYPRNTYEDLVFPMLGYPESLGASQNISIKATTPAAKINSSCIKLSPTDYSTSYSQGRTTSGEVVKRIQLVEYILCPDGTRAELRNTIELGTAKNGPAYFADTLESPNNHYILRTVCSLNSSKPANEDYSYGILRSETYIWGSHSPENERIDHITIQRCDYTWVDVPTEVHLIFAGDEYILDMQNPPKPSTTTSRPWTPAFDVPFTSHSAITGEVSYPEVASESSDTGIRSKQVAVLLKPYGEFAVEALADSAQEDHIVAKLNYNYGFICAQIANLENRFNMTEHSMDREPPPDGLPPIEATVIDKERYRLVQNPGITYALVAILSLVTLVNLWSLIGGASGRFLGKKLPATTSFKALAPDGFNSMAAMGSLIRDSNVFRHLPEGSEVLPTDELYDRMSDLSLRMGWFYSREAKKRIYTIGVVGDDDFVFLASKNESVKEREEHGQENE